MKKNNYEKNVISNKKGCIIFFSLMAMIAIKLLYDWLLKTLTLEEYSPFFFANVKLPFSYSFIIYPFLFAFIFIICIFELPKRKVSDKKYIVYSSIFLCLILVVTVFISCNVWCFDQDTISYNTIFQKDKIVYSYNDIEKAELYIENKNVRLGQTNLNYVLTMSDGNVIKIDALDSFRKNDYALIEFDKKIAEKRKVIGEFEFLINEEDELNEYFHSLF